MAEEEFSDPRFSEVKDGIIVEGLQVGQYRVHPAYWPLLWTLSVDGGLFPFEVVEADVDPETGMIVCELISNEPL